MKSPKFAERIKEVREYYGLGIDEMANCIGISESEVKEFESGYFDTSCKGFEEKLDIIARKLDVSPKYLIGVEDPRESYAEYSLGEYKTTKSRTI